MENKEQILLLFPSEVCDIPQRYYDVPYGCSVVNDNVRLPYIDQLKQIEDDLYAKNRLNIIKGLRDESLSVSQISQLEQLDAAHNEFHKFYENRKTSCTAMKNNIKKFFRKRGNAQSVSNKACSYNRDRHLRFEAIEERAMLAISLPEHAYPVNVTWMELDNVTWMESDSNVSFFSESVHLSLTADDAKTYLASIKETFGLTTKDLAATLRVERQTVYTWIRGENDPSLENNRRIRVIFSFAEEWNQLSKLPAKPALRVPLGKNNEVLLDLLKRDVLNETCIRRQLQIAAKFVNDKESYQPSIEQLIREKGLDPAKYRVSDSEFDAATGKTHFSSEDWE